MAGDRVTIDESMIRYMGRAVAFVQYMPRKPIKHGLKVFAICCSYSAVLLGFEIYCGPEIQPDNSACAVVLRLIAAAGLEGVGRIVYTDNWYTTMDLAIALKEKLGYWFCGTYTLSKKVSRQDKDVPFHLLSTGALASVDRGWFREAVLECFTRTGKKFYAKFETWKDKKQLGILTTVPASIGRSFGHFVKRMSRGRREQSILRAPRGVIDYSTYYNAVDRNDRDSADYTTSLQTNRWYLRIFFWVLDRVIHMVYTCCVFCADHGVGAEWWANYCGKDGRYEFQIDLGLALIHRALQEAWPHPNHPRPDWMRQAAFLPCDCGQCYFCRMHLTSGIAHRQNRPVRTYFHQHDNTRRVTNGCTDVRVDLGRGSRYCRQCYMQQPEFNDAGQRMTAAMKKAACTNSRLGCPSCDEPICQECWDDGYWRHNNQN